MLPSRWPVDMAKGVHCLHKWAKAHIHMLPSEPAVGAELERPHSCLQEAEHFSSMTLRPLV